MEFKTGYGVYPRVQFHPTPLAEGERRGAVQSFREECDINRIMAKYQVTGTVTWLSKHAGQYADVTGVDFSSAMETVVRAQEMFDDLPSSVRDRFANDPSRFFDFMQDDGNLEEMVKLGLATRRTVPVPLELPDKGVATPPA